MPSRYSLAVLPLTGDFGAIGKSHGALAVKLAAAICLASVRHAASIGAPSRYWLAVLILDGEGKVTVGRRHRELAVHPIVLPLAGGLAAIS